MSKNLIPEIAKLLGVEIGEEFKITGYGEAIYKFTNDGLVLNQRDGFGLEITVAVKAQLDSLLNGKDEIIKLSWKPKEGTEVYTFSFTTHEYNSRFCPHKGVWYVTKWNWAGFPWQIALLDKGWVYRTQKEAEAALPKVASKLGVKYKCRRL